MMSREIFDLILAFRPAIVSGDNTGHGIPIMDELEKHLRDNGFNPNILKRVNFTMQSKEQMAQGFKNIVMPDVSDDKSRYRWLYKMKKHENSIRHCLRVEKELLPQGGVRYSGKMHGRDDHFWSKAQLALITGNPGIIKAAFGRFNKSTLVPGEINKKSFATKFLENQDKKSFLNYEDTIYNEEMAKERHDKILKEKNLKFAIQCLTMGKVVCRSVNKIVSPIHCASIDNCTDEKCDGYKAVNEICLRYEVSRDELWKRQTIY
jgi:hypothetical protein